MSRGIYITGTDTGIGKTHAAVAVLHALHKQGVRAVGMKPVASGCVETPEGWRNDDALALLDASAGSPGYEYVNPIALSLATAPEIAARASGIEVTLSPLVEAFAQLFADADFVVVEGVGGWAAPLSTSLDQADLVRALGLPVVLVVGLKLGCINHARLTAMALAAAKVEVCGFIANAVDPDFEHAQDTLEILRARLAPMPCLGLVPHALPGAASPDIDLSLASVEPTIGTVE